MYIGNHLKKKAIKIEVSKGLNQFIQKNIRIFEIRFHVMNAYE